MSPMRAAVVVAVIAAAMAGVASARTLVEPHPGVPDSYTHVARADPETRLTVTIAVKQTNTDVLESTLIRVSDPEHADWNKLMTFEEVNALVAPRPESIARVVGFLKEHKVASEAITATPNSDFLNVETTVEVAEAMLGAEYHVYEHTATQSRIVRLSGEYSLPSEIAEHVDFVGPTVRFPTPMLLKKSGGFDDDSGGGVDPTFLRKLYNVGTTEGTASNNLQACAQFLGQYYDPSDLATFFQQDYKPAVGRKVEKVIGPNDASNPGIEATLDIEYIMSMGGNVPTIFWSTKGQQPHNPQNEPFLVWLTNLASTDPAPVTISTSYGDNENGVNFPYAQRVNTEFQKAGVRGISLMYSSGDGGVAGGQPTSCTTFIPTFPAGSPWVTAVGGTTGSGPETAASLSSGGFSDYWARPAWQDSAIAHYMSTATGLPSKSVFNQTGAGFPDVAAQAENFVIVYGGSSTGVAGTSCSSPTFSGVLSLVNDARLAAGKKSLGFLNQLIWKNGDVFNDITSGSNPGCGTNGFQAAAGWDPVTGWGSPDYQKLKALAMSLP